MASRVHFIAVGGSAMHNLAIALKKKGFHVTGSDDEIFEPSRSRLEQHGLLPSSFGWNPENISEDINAIILGMHARKDNPELLAAQEMGLNIYSYPEYIYEQSKDKQRIVIAGSHGKTSITSIILHILKTLDKKFDYMVGAQLEGFDTMVKLSDAPIIILEGDEYLSSPIDLTPKFLKYHHHIGVISGIAWDHINVFSTEEEYISQFDHFADATPKAGSLIYCDDDAMSSVIGAKERDDVNRLPYKIHPYKIDNGKTYLISDFGDIPVKIFGEHNMQNISAAKAVLQRIGIQESDFYNAIQSFKGAAKRLEELGGNDYTKIYIDFAHAPSKLMASVNAIKRQYNNRRLIACVELHTYSSLNKDFISQYDGSFSEADIPVVYVNPNTISHKKLPAISKDEITNAFGDERLLVFEDKNALETFLTNQNWKDTNLLLMSSGNFDNLNMSKIKEKIIN